MRWKGRQASTNVDDRRGGRKGSRGKRIGTGFGLGTIILLIVVYFLGGDPVALMQQMEPQGSQAPQNEAPAPTRADDELAEFVSVVLKDTEDAWHKIFREQMRARYEEPTLVLFTGSVTSACGQAGSSTGPFYCPGDQKLYIDLSFYQDLKNRFGAPGDFAMAYVVAHEVAHHVQYLMGTTQELNRQRRRVSKTEYNKLSVKLELQADFFAGVWAHHAQEMKDILEKGDIEEALNAAKAIGDDRIQMRSRGYIVPESFTHGTSDQRMRWFNKGFETGDMSQGDTFGARVL